MNIALVDDETTYLKEMETLCHNFGAQNQCQIETVCFSSGEQFLEAFEQDKFSIVFMDIYMKGINGITTALSMREKDNCCLLVFLTSSMEFMPDAFSCHAFEYITKPFSPDRVYAILHDALQVLPPPPKYIEIISDRKTFSLFLHDIVSVVTDAHYLVIGTTDGSVLRTRMTMPKFLQLTGNDPCFISINKGIVLNADYIQDFENNCCILDNGARFPVRVRNRLKIEQAVRDDNFEKIRSQQRIKRMH